MSNQQKSSLESRAHNNASSTSSHNLQWYRRRRSPAFLLFLGAGILVVGLIAFLGLQLFANTGTPPPGITSNLPGSSGGGKSTPTQKGSSPWNDQEFVTTVMNYAAGKLHLSLGDLTARVQAGMGFRDVASQQGFSAEQVHTLELDALQAGLNKLVSLNKLTRDQADNDKEHWQQRNPQLLDVDFTFALGGVPTIPKDLVTVTPQSK